jgi:photosystem II stability/assembly factor-like uncharacterized protein
MSGLYSIEFVNPTTGWATGPTGKVKRTTDGGNSWQTSSPTPSYYRAIDFVNPMKGWIVGTAGMIQHTADGGLTWQDQSTQTGTLYGVSFADEEHGVAVGGTSKTLLRTENGGKDWIAIAVSHSPRDVCLTPNGHGWAAAGSVILRTINYGKSWTKQPLTSGQYASKVVCVDDNTGFAVGNDGMILKTTNGGSSPAP